MIDLFKETGITFTMGDVKATVAQLRSAYNVPKQTLYDVINTLKADGLVNGTKIRTVARDGKNRVSEVFNLDETIAIGFRLRSDVAIQLQRWAIGLVKKELTTVIEKNYYLQIENDKLWDKDDHKKLYR